jgi:AraC-like DNA-binding protein
MGSSNNFWHILVLIGGLQGLLLGLFLLFHAGKINSTTNRILSALLCSVSIDMIFTYLNLSDIIIQYPSLISISDPLYPLFGPLLYLFVIALTSETFIFKKKYILFFLPVFFEFVNLLPFLSISDEDKLHTLWSLSYGGYRANEYVFFWTIELLFNTGMTIAAAVILRKYAQRLKDFLSDTKRVNLIWLRRFIYLCIVFLLLQLIFIVLFYAGFSSISTAFTWVYCLMAVSFYLTSYWALTKPEIFLTSDKAVKYHKTSLPAEKAELLEANLLELMKEKKPYLDNSIRIGDIAALLSVSTNHLSQIINQNLGKNFYDFINQYRVDEAKLLMQDPLKQKLTLIAIAMDAGFNSKSTFNKVFKELTRQTPSEYYQMARADQTK